jgi:hypothetical protein
MFNVGQASRLSLNFRFHCFENGDRLEARPTSNRARPAWCTGRVSV